MGCSSWEHGGIRWYNTFLEMPIYKPWYTIFSCHIVSYSWPEAVRVWEIKACPVCLEITLYIHIKPSVSPSVDYTRTDADDQVRLTTDKRHSKSNTAESNHTHNGWIENTTLCTNCFCTRHNYDKYLRHDALRKTKTFPCNISQNTTIRGQPWMDWGWGKLS